VTGYRNKTSVRPAQWRQC